MIKVCLLQVIFSVVSLLNMLFEKVFQEQFHKVYPFCKKFQPQTLHYNKAWLKD